MKAGTWNAFREVGKWWSELTIFGGGAVTEVAAAGALAKSEYVIVEVNPRNLISQQSKNEMTGSVIKRLAKDMKVNGFDPREPISVVVRSDGRLVISDGHHRAAAAIKAGLDKVPVEIYTPVK